MVEIGDLSGVKFLARTFDDEGADKFAPFLIRQPDNRRFENRRVRREGVFRICRVYVLAARAAKDGRQA